MGNEILSNLEDIANTNMVEKAYEFIRGWILSNIEQFKGNPKPESYGLMDKNRFYIFPQILQDALEKQGYSYKKIMQGFGDRGYIDTTYEKRRNKEGPL